MSGSKRYVHLVHSDLLKDISGIIKLLLQSQTMRIPIQLSMFTQTYVKLFLNCVYLIASFSKKQILHAKKLILLDLSCLALIGPRQKLLPFECSQFVVYWRSTFQHSKIYKCTLHNYKNQRANIGLLNIKIFLFQHLPNCFEGLSPQTLALFTFHSLNFL